MAAQEEAVSFNAMIQADRKRRKDEALANEIFGKNRRASAPGAGANRRAMTGPGASLASRVGVTKPPHRSASSTPKPGLSQGSNPRISRIGQPPRSNSASRLEHRNNRLYDSLRSDTTPVTAQANITSRPLENGTLNARAPQNGLASERAPGINIRGMGSASYCVVASNFAPGTTAADIEAVMTPIGGEMISCKLVSAKPTVIAEMLFTEKTGAENVISMFNGKKADGRVLYVYMKHAPPQQEPRQSYDAAHSRPPAPPPASRPDRDVMEVDDEPPAAAPAPPTAPARREQYDQPVRRAEPQYQDGRYGFSEQAPRDDSRDARRDDRRGRDGYRLYSDRIGGRDWNYRR